MSQLTITDAAVQRINQLAKEEPHPVMLRIVVNAGGCHGMQYTFDFDTQQNEDDTIFQNQGAKVIIDQASLSIISGSEIDYKEDLIGAAFVLNNPQAASSCGCGNSFSL